MANSDPTIQYSIDYSLTGPVSSPFLLQAYRIHFSAQYPLKCPGGNVTLIAQEIVFDNGSVIDVSGAPGQGVGKAGFGTPPNTGSQGPNGGDGSDGTVNQAGNNGGSISIYANIISGPASLLANGGVGGPGQDGGDGAPGQTDVDGKAGGNGGNAGAGGPGGNGGNGGSITVIGCDLNAANLTLSVTGAAGGAPGNHGAPGPGGQGGRPACRQIHLHGPDGGFSYQQCDAPPPGGAAGGLHQQIAPEGVTGPNGIAISKVDVSAMVSNATRTLQDAYWTALLDKASESYYDNDFATASALLHWLDQIGSNGHPPIDAVVNRARTLLSQMRSGLDVYGFPKNYVPSLSVGTFETNNKTLIDDGIALESDVTTYLAKQADQQATMTAINSSVQKAQDQINKNTSDRQDLINQSKTISQQLTELLTEEMKAQSVLSDAAANLKASLGNPGGCTLSEIISAASLIATFATGLPVAAGTIASAASTAGNDLGQPPTMNNVNSVVKQVLLIKNTVGDESKKISDMVKAYGDIKSSLGKAPDPTYDATKILMDQKDFSDVRAQFESKISQLPPSSEKDTYEDAANNYLNIVQVRNQQLLSFNGLAFKVQDIDANNASLTQNIGQLNNQKLALQAANADVITQQLTDLKSGLLKSAYFQLLLHSRALDYWTLNPTEPDIEYPDFTALKGILAKLLLRKTDALTKFLTPPGSFSTNSPLTISLRPDDQNALGTTGQFSFILDIGDANFSNLAQVLAQTFTISFIAADGSQISPLKLILEHSGYHKFRDMSGNYYEFLTQPRPVAVNSGGQINISSQFSGPDLSLDSGYAAASAYVGVSPFTRWKIWTNDNSEFASLARATTIQISMSGTARALKGPAL